MSDEILLPLDSDYKQIGSETFIELPIKGPGDANRLVMLNGIAFSGSDDNGFGLNSDDSKRSFDLFVNTKYRLADADQWLKIVDGNTDLIQTTWVSLCAITADEEGGFAVALDSMTAGVNSNKRVQLEVNPAGLIGDATILKVAYQVNFLIKKAVG